MFKGYPPVFMSFIPNFLPYKWELMPGTVLGAGANIDKNQHENVLYFSRRNSLEYRIHWSLRVEGQ